MKALFLGVVLALGWAGCAHLTAQDQSELLEYKTRQEACVLANPGNQVAIELCRAAVKQDFNARWNARFDGGFGG